MKKTIRAFVMLLILLVISATAAYLSRIPFDDAAKQAAVIWIIFLLLSSSTKKKNSKLSGKSYRERIDDIAVKFGVSTAVVLSVNILACLFFGSAMGWLAEEVTYTGNGIGVGITSMLARMAVLWYE